ncbi:Lar family restriction alleviation protein [Pseudomonas helleri]|uniref:Lar family restriction alleviation protein n=1 Tax=Pseudomonas helleri TaxID=1608996 RepID=UPI003F9C8E5D
MTSKLLPCPFCGGSVKPAFRKPAGHDIAFVINCNCGCVFSPICAMEDDCERAWNKRATPISAGHSGCEIDKVDYRIE